MLYLSLSFVMAMLIVLALTPHIINIAKVKHLFDVPDERKVHKNQIPRLGGLVVAIGFLFTALFFMDTAVMKEWNYLLCAILVILAVGFKDDIIGVSSGKKLVAQILASLIVIFFGGINLTNFHGFLGIYEIPFWVGSIFSLITIIVVTNSFNLIDGINGLLGMIGCITSLSFGILFYLMGLHQFALIAFTITGALVGFLYYNITPAKVFMGDTGSLLLGFLMSILAIKFIELHPTAVYRLIEIKASVATSLSILILPLYDTLRVFTIRALQRKSPFSPDRNHIHHLLIDCNISHLAATLILVLFSTGIVIMVLLLQDIGNNYLFLLMAAIVFTATFILTKVRNLTVANNNKKNTKGKKVLKHHIETITNKEIVGV